jgi:hypothetical protein
MSIVTKDTSSVALAFSVLMDTVKENPAILQNSRMDIVTLAKAVGLEINCDISAAVPENGQRYQLVIIGQKVEHVGIPFGEWKSGRKTIGLNLIPDFLRDNSGEIVRMNGNEAVDAMAALNGGVKYGNGYEKAIAQAIAKSEFRDGSLILARQSDLVKIAKERETNPSLKQMNEMIASGSYGDSWCVSSTEGSGFPSNVYHVSVKVGSSDWDYKDIHRSRVVVLRGFNCG